MKATAKTTKNSGSLSERAARRSSPKRLGPEPAVAEVRLHMQPGGVVELVGNTEAAKILGVTPSNLYPNRGMAGLPEPVVDYLSRGKLWLRRDIEAFKAEREESAANRRKTS